MRAHFDLKQWELASYLRISRTLLAMVESGERSLPTAALMRFVPLAVLLPAEIPAASASDDAAPPPETLSDSPPEAPTAPLEHPQLRHRLAVCRHEARQLRHELAPSVARAEAAARFIAAVPALLAAAPPPPELTTPAAEARALRWVEEQRQEAERTLHTHGPAARAVREVRLLALEWEAAELQRRLPPEPLGAGV